jgi:hypothetical protein
VAARRSRAPLPRKGGEAGVAVAGANRGFEGGMEARPREAMSEWGFKREWFGRLALFKTNFSTSKKLVIQGMK